MPYKIYKKNGYKACKPGGQKCFSKKGMSKEKARAQQKALYANESLDTSSAGNLNFVAVYTNVDEAYVVYTVKKHPEIKINIVYTLRDSFYPSYEHFTLKDHGDHQGQLHVIEDPQSEEAIALLKMHGLTSEDIEMAGQGGHDKITQHFENESSADSFEESLEFEALADNILNEKEPTV
jgi:hypothetical protein